MSSSGARFVSQFLVLALLAPTGVRADNCADWGGSVRMEGSTGDCLRNAQEESQKKAQDARDRGAADQTQAKNAGEVADKLDGDKSNAQSTANAMPPEQKSQFAQRPYRLEEKYSKMYTQLDRYNKERTGASLPPQPATNHQLMSYDTKPLRHLESEAQKEADDLFDQARKATAAGARFAELKNEAYRRQVNIGSVDQGRNLILPTQRANGTLDGSAFSSEDSAAGDGLTRRVHAPGKESDISKRSGAVTLAAGLRASPSGSDRDARARKPKLQRTPDATDDAFAKLDAAKQALAHAQAAAEADRPRTAAEHAIEQLTQAPASAAPMAVGMAAASFGAAPPGAAVSAAEPDPVSTLSSPEALLSTSLFDLVGRQYKKRMRELAGNP